MSRKNHPIPLDRPAPAVLTHGRPHTRSELTLPIGEVEPVPPAITKPPYRVPGMAEIDAVPWNGFSVVSTFSGCGGSCLGFKMAGFNVLWASEFIPAAQETYRSNHRDTPLDTRDIRQIQAEDILVAVGKAPGEIDVLEGSPPCASFSTAGKREAGWGKVRAYSDTRQRTDDLFFEFARLLGGLRPKVFVAENVSGLVKGKAKGFFLDILRALVGYGYQVESRLLDAQWLGVPQARQRLIFIGVREDLGLAPAFPRPLPYRYSVREALPGFSGSLVTAGNERHTLAGRRPTRPPLEPAPTVLAEEPRFSVIEAGADISRFAIGREWDRLRSGQKSERYLNLIRPDPEEPCPTICQSHGNPSTAGVTHPTERRKFTIAELKRICAFPDDFTLTGTYAQQWERLGRAVPSLMMRAVAEVIRDEILCKLPNK
jgi:DNA (cytosine-5)-methyltransferase 1